MALQHQSDPQIESKPDPLLSQVQRERLTSRLSGLHHQRQPSAHGFIQSMNTGSSRGQARTNDVGPLRRLLPSEVNIATATNHIMGPLMVVNRRYAKVEGQ